MNTVHLFSLAVGRQNPYGKKKLLEIETGDRKMVSWPTSFTDSLNLNPNIGLVVVRHNNS